MVVTKNGQSTNFTRDGYQLAVRGNDLGFRIHRLLYPFRLVSLGILLDQRFVDCP